MYFLTIKTTDLGKASGLAKAAGIIKKWQGGNQAIDPLSGCFGDGYVQLDYKLTLGDVTRFVAGCAEDISTEYRFTFSVLAAKS